MGRAITRQSRAGLRRVVVVLGLLVAATASVVPAADPVELQATGHERAGRDRPASALREFRRANPTSPVTPLGPNVGCMFCHDELENATANMSSGYPLHCTVCHGGDATTTVKELAHVQPSLPVIMDATVPPLDYDLAYQKFVNPSNLRVVEGTCGGCHPDTVQAVKESMMATAAGHYAGGLYQGGVVESKTPIYGTFAIDENDPWIPFEAGAVESLDDLVIYDPANDPALYSTHFQAVPSQACARCHLWSRGKGYRGAVGAEGVYRADGCAACHMPYADDGLSRSADTMIDHAEPGHPMGHTITRAIPTEQCLHCHHRGARIGLSYTGRAQMPPRLPSGPGVAGTTGVRFNGNYHYADALTNPPDVHHQSGMHCIDCHVAREIMGDDNIYGHMDQATKIECQTCHGTPTAEASLRDNDGRPLPNVRRGANGSVELNSKVGQVAGAGLPRPTKHRVTQAADLVNPASPRFNANAARAMNASHLKAEGGLECYACHSSWVPNCFGCHFERDERLTGLNLMTGEHEIGRASTNNKIFESLKYFMMGPNSSGRIASYIVGCQPIADVTAVDGTKILDFAMPYTVNGLSGLALQPVQSHTVRGRKEVRACAECHRAPPTLGLGSGNYAVARKRTFVAGAGGVAVLDGSATPTSPAPAGTLGASEALALAVLPDVVEGSTDYLYVAAGAGGVRIYDLRDELPEAPLGVVEGIYAIDVARAARYLYVVDKGVGVRIYDNDDPAVAELVATIPVPGALRVVPWGIHLFVAAGPDGLSIVDVADPAAPAIVGGLAGIHAADVALYAHYQDGNAFAVRAYVADPGFGVRVVDLLPDFDAPRLVGGATLAGAVALDTYTRYLPAHDGVPSREHDYLYVAAGRNGLHVFDITLPDAIEAVAALDGLGGSVDDLDVASRLAPPGVDDYALLANRELGLQIVDVTDPLQPALAGTVAAPGAARVFVEVQQLDRFLDEEGRPQKENSHPGTGTLSREQIVRILRAPIADGS